MPLSDADRKRYYDQIERLDPEKASDPPSSGSTGTFSGIAGSVPDAARQRQDEDRDSTRRYLAAMVRGSCRHLPAHSWFGKAADA